MSTKFWVASSRRRAVFNRPSSSVPVVVMVDISPHHSACDATRHTAVPPALNASASALTLDKLGECYKDLDASMKDETVIDTSDAEEQAELDRLRPRQPFSGDRQATRKVSPNIHHELALSTFTDTT
jgi:hypothetical protein